MKEKPKKVLKKNANYQGSVKVPLPPKEDYGNGLPNKKIPKAKCKGVK